MKKNGPASSMQLAMLYKTFSEFYKKMGKMDESREFSATVRKLVHDSFPGNISKQ